ncbi:MAG: hypothetical protein ACTSQA_03475 [Candidatus Heimdallarchaeaceae archaeon]
MANNTGKKYGGRKKGTPNKLTKELRDLLKDIVYHELENIEERLDELDEKERLDMIIKLMPYVFPKLSSQNADSDEPNDWGN